MTILEWIVIAILSVLGLYLVARLVTAAIMRSYYEAKKRARKEAKNDSRTD